ncbi:MAG: hypothetical protein B7Z66_09220 [Chromatiales bacterium 21-64-14]|nr:MAG: hypothetical protein B7Z66_09220 [Chromatiales bacterium 21-64-14]HQU15291.1 glycosyltransferase [Gammaproteobacteria bacterium]
MQRVQVLLVAKPWRGGLARYVFQALQDLLPGDVAWIPTYPVGAADRLAYVRDRARWRRALVARIGAVQYRAALFINHFPELDGLPPDDRHVLWLTDGPEPDAGGFMPYHRVFVSDPGYGEAIRGAVGTRRYAGELAFAFHPDIHRPQADRGRPEGFCMIANRDVKRDFHLGMLLAVGLRPRVYGNYFLRHPLALRHPGCFRPRVSNDAMGRVYARHALSLNVHARVLREGTNMRSFECAGYGVPQLIEYRPGLERHFEPDAEVAVYREPGQAVDAVRGLLADPRRARELAARAARRALAEHTYHHRLARALDGLISAARLRRPGH